MSFTCTPLFLSVLTSSPSALSLPLSLPFPYFLSLIIIVTELIPLLATSTRVTVEQPILRSSGQTMVLKTSHICQWLEVAASFYTTVTVQELLLRKGNYNNNNNYN